MMFALVNGVIVGAMYGLFALSIVLVHRGTKVINFAAPGLGSFGLHIAYTLAAEQQVNWLASAIVGVLVSAGIALLFERFVVRRMTDATTLSISVATIGLMLVLLSIELFVWTGAGNRMPHPLGGDGATIAGVVVTPTKMLSIAAAVILGVGLTQFLRRTDFGLGVQAAAMDRDAVRLVGVRLHEVNAFVWSVGAMIAVIAALLVMPTIGAFAPGTVTSVFFIPALAAALIGGIDDLGGAFLGGLVVGVATELSTKVFLGSDFSGSQHVTVFISIVLVLLFAPKGVVQRLRPTVLRLAGGTA